VCDDAAQRLRSEARALGRLVSRLSEFAVAGHPFDGAMTKISEFALEEHVSLSS
jgi:hypothetical protein